jgi:predicted RNA polymerase sigma factor
VVALARVHGPAAGLGALAELESDRRMAGYHRLHATRGHLLGLAGQHGPAAAAYREAARRATSVPERRYLSRMAAEQAEQAEQAGAAEQAEQEAQPPGRGVP